MEKRRRSPSTDLGREPRVNDRQPEPLALRVGRPGAEVLAACDESTTDLVVAWSRDLTPGRAAGRA
jgi:hypothetical protein